jgi:plasmid stabilization system protein ParE
MKIQYSPEAIEDLVRLREFIEVKNSYAAKLVAAQILPGIEKLKSFPEIGILVQRSPEPKKIRDLFVSNYTIRYLIGKDSIFILRVWHGKEIEKDL